MKQKRRFATLLMATLLIFACGTKNPSPAAKASKKQSVQQQSQATEAKITFVELGSVKCLPCRQMQPVIASIEKKYGDQIQVVFYDVWKADQQHYAKRYNIRLIPTQVFLDENGNELLRHEGFFPEEEIDIFLQSQGLQINSGGTF